MSDINQWVNRHKGNVVDYLNSDTSTAGARPVYAASVSAVLSASQNNYSPTGYSSDTTRLLLAAAGGGSTLTGLDATGVADGASILVRNTSAVDSITFSHLSGSSAAANQFSCPGAVSAVIGPLAGVLLIYIANQWTFG